MTGTVIEINSGPPHLPPWFLLRQAAEEGVIVVMNNDVHYVHELDPVSRRVMLDQFRYVPPGAIANSWQSELFLS